MRNTFAMILAAAVAGCGGSNAQLDVMRSNSELRIERTAGPGYDYTVIIRNGWSFDYDPNDKATRDSIALRGIKAECPQASITSEEFLKLGEAATKRQLGEWYMRIRCRPA